VLVVGGKVTINSASTLHNFPEMWHLSTAQDI